MKPEGNEYGTSPRTHQQHKNSLTSAGEAARLRSPAQGPTQGPAQAPKVLVSKKIIITTQKWTVTQPRPSHLASCRVRRAHRGLVFGHRGSVGGPTTAAGISSLADRSLATIIARRRLNASAGVVATTFGISSRSFGKDGLRNIVGFGLKLKNMNSHRC